MSEPKTLTIDFDYDKPKFTFQGTWIGRDISVIQTSIRREYLRHQQALRHESKPSEIEPALTDKE